MLVTVYLEPLLDSLGEPGDERFKALAVESLNLLQGVPLLGASEPASTVIGLFQASKLLDGRSVQCGPAFNTGVHYVPLVQDRINWRIAGVHRLAH
ncbi:hypothetical protein [Streptomyces sp. GbtcB6]|uniref:hypothetical protein n=1 Tax=Streptomyces sp. GbtcB6 TaxID=2824751 RepID=UPI0020C7263F|nr:hypothetical protein [Streptomyces sp. GbtcB6]